MTDDEEKEAVHRWNNPYRGYVQFHYVIQGQGFPGIKYPFETLDKEFIKLVEGNPRFVTPRSINIHIYSPEWRFWKFDYLVNVENRQSLTSHLVEALSIAEILVKQATKRPIDLIIESLIEKLS